VPAHEKTEEHTHCTPPPCAALCVLVALVNFSLSREAAGTKCYPVVNDWGKTGTLYNPHTDKDPFDSLSSLTHT